LDGVFVSAFCCLISVFSAKLDILRMVHNKAKALAFAYFFRWGKTAWLRRHVDEAIDMARQCPILSYSGNVEVAEIIEV